jgi:hypothetical protein
MPCSAWAALCMCLVLLAAQQSAAIASLRQPTASGLRPRPQPLFVPLPHPSQRLDVTSLQPLLATHSAERPEAVAGHASVALHVVLSVAELAAADAATERQALSRFYSLTAGPLWLNNSGWSDASDLNVPVCQWFGVVCDSTASSVTALMLPANNLQSDNLPDDVSAFPLSLEFTRTHTAVALLSARSWLGSTTCKCYLLSATCSPADSPPFLRCPTFGFSKCRPTPFRV